MGVSETGNGRIEGKYIQSYLTGVKSTLKGLECWFHCLPAHEQPEQSSYLSKHGTSLSLGSSVHSSAVKQQESTTFTKNQPKDATPLLFSSTFAGFLCIHLI